jgi:hypothetical protein
MPSFTNQSGSGTSQVIEFGLAETELFGLKKSQSDAGHAKFRVAFVWNEIHRSVLLLEAADQLFHVERPRNHWVRTGSANSGSL